MEDEDEYCGPTYRYFRSKLQRKQADLLRQRHMLEQQQRQERASLRRMAAIIAGFIARPDTRTQYLGCEAALAHFLEEIKPGDDFRDEAVQILRQV